MAANYLDMLAKLQAQTLEGLKQVQAVQVASLTTARDMVASLPTSIPAVPSVPTIEGMPTFAQIADLNASFASQILEQQKTYAHQLAEIFTPLSKASSN